MNRSNGISLDDYILRYLKTANYNCVYVASYDLNMIIVSDDIVCIYYVIQNRYAVDEEIASAVDCMCKLRDKLVELFVDTLDITEMYISMYLFIEGQYAISSRSKLLLSLKDTQLIECDKRKKTFNNYFPKLTLAGNYVEAYMACTDYMQAAANYIDKITICDDDEIEEELQSESTGIFKYSSPRALADEVKKFVKGQDEVVDSVAIPFFQHIESMHNNTTCETKNSFIIIGNTGTGKSEILRRYAQLCDVPIIRINMADCTPSSWKGQHIQDHISFYINSRADLEKLRYAVLVFNEFDKITHYNTVATSSTGTDWDMDMQRELFRFYDKGYELLIERPTPKGTLETYRLPTDNFLLCFDGAFSGIEKIIEKRIGKTSRIGYSSQQEEQEQSGDLSKLKAEDLEKWGYMPELLGRIGSFYVMNPMSENLMVAVLTTASENILEAHVNQCARYGITLKIEEDAVRYIARKATEMKLGLRAVRSILNKILQPIYFDCDEYKGKDLVLNTDFINGDINI